MILRLANANTLQTNRNGLAHDPHIFLCINAVAQAKYAGYKHKQSLLAHILPPKCLYHYYSKKWRNIELILPLKTKYLEKAMQIDYFSCSRTVLDIISFKWPRLLVPT